MTASTGEAIGVVVVAAFLILTACRTGPDDDARPTLPDRVEGWGAAGPVDRWDGQSIYDYIDGHAEVYLAYGMRGCISKRYAGPEGEPDLIVDVFEMASPEDAFGVFTHDRSGEPVNVGRDARYRWGWLSFWQGPYFVSVTAEADTERARAAVLELAEAIAASLPEGGDRPVIVDVLPADGLDPESVRFLHDPTVLNAHLWSGPDNPFALDDDTPAALGRYRSGDGQEAHVLVVGYPNVERARSAVGSAMPDGATEGVAVETDAGWVAWTSAGGSRMAFVLGGSSRDVTEALVDRLVSGG